MKNKLILNKMQILSLLTAIALLITIMPSGLFKLNANAVESYKLKVGGIEVTSETRDSYYASQGWKYTPPTETSPGILTLNGATITGYSEYSTAGFQGNTAQNGAGIFSENELIINCISDSRIAPSSTGDFEMVGIRCLANVTFTGTAPLTVVAPTCGNESTGISVRDLNAGTGSYKKMTVKDGAILNISTQNCGTTTAIKAHLHVYDATVNATAGNYTSDVGTSAGIRGNLFTYKNSGVVNISAGNNNSSGTSTSSYGATGTLNIRSGTVSVSGKSYCASSTGNLSNYKYISVLVGSSASDCTGWDGTTYFNNYKYVKFQRGAYNVYVGSTRVTADNSSDVLGDGKVKFEIGEYDEPSVITLNGANITSARGDSNAYYGIYSEKALKVISNGTDSISTASYSGKANNYAVFSGEALTVGGLGSLTATAGAASGTSCALSGTSLTVSECSVTAFGNTKAFSAVPDISACPSPYILAGVSAEAAAEVDASSYTFTDKYVNFSPITVYAYNTTSANTTTTDALVINRDCNIALSVTAEGAPGSTYLWKRHVTGYGFLSITLLVSSGLFPATAFLGEDTGTLRINTFAAKSRDNVDGLYMCTINTNGTTSYQYFKITLNHEDGECVNTNDANYHSLTCINCPLIEKQSHYNKWTVLREETETDSGLMRAVCTTCGYTAATTTFTSASSDNASITLYGNGGTVDGENSNIFVTRSGVPKTFESINIWKSGTNIIAREGYALLGWAHDPYATLPDYYADDYMFVGSNNMSLYAVWLHMPQREVSLSCEIPSICRLSSDVTAKLYCGSTVIKAFAFTDTISLDDIPDGTYTLVLTKSGYVRREYPVTMGSANVVLDAEIWRIGDITNNGTIDAVDCMLSELARSGHIKPSDEEAPYYDAFQDVLIDDEDFHYIINYALGIE